MVLPPDSRYAHKATATVLADGVSATIADCAIDDSIVERQGTGEVLNDELQAQLVGAQMVRTDSGWKVSNVTFIKSWPGETQCHVAA